MYSSIPPRNLLKKKYFIKRQTSKSIEKQHREYSKNKLKYTLLLSNQNYTQPNPKKHFTILI